MGFNLLTAVLHGQFADGGFDRQLPRAEIDLRDLNDASKAKERSDQILRLLTLRALHNVHELSTDHSRKLREAEHECDARMSEFLRMSQAESHHVDATARTRDAVEVQEQSREEQAQLECSHIMEHKLDICVSDESVNEEDLEG